VTDITELKKARHKAEDTNRRLGEIHKFDNIIGKSRAMQHLFLSIKAAIGSQATILLQGESGTGKELVAGAIHYNSNRYKMQLSMPLFFAMMSISIFLTFLLKYGRLNIIPLSQNQLTGLQVIYRHGKSFPKKNCLNF